MTCHLDLVSIKNGPLATTAWQPGGGDRKGAWKGVSIPIRCAGLHRPERKNLHGEF